VFRAGGNEKHRTTVKGGEPDPCKEGLSNWIIPVARGLSATIFRTPWKEVAKEGVV